MNELVAIFNNCIKSKSSLKECVEFAFHDEEIGMGEKGKLVALITDGGSKKANMTDAYKAMLPENKKVEDGEYLYIIAAYDWSVTEPEAEFEFAVLDTVQMYSGHKAVVSIHVCDEANQFDEYDVKANLAALMREVWDELAAHYGLQ